MFSKNSLLFQQANKGKYYPNVIVSTLILIIIIILAHFLTIIINSLLDNILTITNNVLINNAVNYAVKALLVPCLLIILLIFIITKYIEKRNISTLGLNKHQKPFKKYIRGFVLGFIMIGTCTFFLVITNNVVLSKATTSYTGTKALAGIFIVLIGWIIQGASEEIMMRGWFMTSVGVRHNIPLAIFSSSIIFALLHLGNSNLTLLSIVNIVIFGLFAAFYSILDKSIWGICGLHTSWNWAQGNIMGFEVSGNIPAGGILFDFKCTGSDLITGGNFGLEGGFTVTAVLLIGILITYILSTKQNNNNRINNYYS